MSLKASIHRLASRTRDLALRYRGDRGANVNIIYAFALVPTIGLIGIGVDWFEQESFNKRFQNAADAAAVAAVTTARAYVVANASKSNVTTLAIAAGVAQAQKTFAVNIGSAASKIAVTPQISFPSPVGSTYTATVSYSTTMPTNFGGLFGVKTFPLVGTSVSSMTLGLYLDFYVAVDVSASMGIPTTLAGQNALAAVNPDKKSDYPAGCTFACHYSDAQGYTVSRSNNITLRIDTVGQAVNSMITTAGQQAANNGIANEYRIGLYPFIDHAIDAAPLSSSFTTAQQLSNNLADNYLDQGWDSGMPKSSNGTYIGSGGTHFENLSNDMSKYYKTSGNGQTAAAPKPFLFIITDGVDNAQTYSPWTTSQPQLPVCTSVPSGFTVAILYIPYVPITHPNSSYADNEDGKVNALIPQVPSTLQSCATPGFFFTASSAADIQNAMQTMFFQAVQSARLTQ